MTLADRRRYLGLLFVFLLPACGEGSGNSSAPTATELRVQETGAPIVTGNVATEDVVWMLHRAGFETGIDLAPLARLADAPRPRTEVHVLADGDVLFDCQLH